MLLLEIIISITVLSSAILGVNYTLQSTLRISQKISHSFRKLNEPKNCNPHNINNKSIIVCKDHIFLQKGFSLSEAMCSLIISGLATAAIVKETNFLSKLNVKHQHEITKISSVQKWQTLVDHAVKNMDRARIPISLKVFNGTPRYSDNTEIKVSNQAYPYGNGFMAIIFYDSLLLRVEKTKSTNNLPIIKICQDRTKETLPGNFDAIGISDNFMAEINVSASFINTSPELRCSAITIQLNNPLLLPNNEDISIGNIFVIQPVKERYIYYLDKNQTLRRLQVNQNQVIEQQPVEAKMLPISIELSTHYPVESYVISDLESHYKSLILRKAPALSLLMLSLTR